MALGGFCPYPSLPHGANTKGGETLLAAWEAGEAALHALGASLLLAGPRADSPQLVGWRETLQFPDRVYLGGDLAPELIPAYIRSADAVLIPSMEEGLPNVGMEAAACGRPVVGSRVGGLPEIVLDGETGFVLPAGDASAWTNALIECAARPEIVSRMGPQARKHAVSAFDRSRFAPSMDDLYRTVLLESSIP